MYRYNVDAKIYFSKFLLSFVAGPNSRDPRDPAEVVHEFPLKSHYASSARGGRLWRGGTAEMSGPDAHLLTSTISGGGGGSSLTSRMTPLKK